MHARTLEEEGTPGAGIPGHPQLAWACGLLQVVGERWVAHTCRLNTQETEAGWLEVRAAQG